MLARHILEDRSPRWERQNPCHGSKTENQTLMCTWQMNENRSPSIWRRTWPWRFCKTSVLRMIIPWHISPSFCFSSIWKITWIAMGRENPMSRIPLQGFGEEQRGRRIMTEAPGSPSFMHPSNSGGGSAPLLPPHRGQAIVLISHCLITSWLISEEGSSQAPAVS